MKKRGLYILLSLGLLVLLLLGRYYYVGFPREKGAWITVLSFPLFIGCIYAGRPLCSKWFVESRSVWYLLYFLPCLAFILVFWYAIVRFTLNLPDIGFTELSVGYGPFFILGLVTGFLVKLIRAYTQKQLNEALALAAQKENELHRLQSQLSPHFLFNTLNNLYGISISDHQRVPKLLLKLSELLRYSLYDTSQQFVPLKEELAYIRNYIEFEKMRISDRLILQEDLEEPANVSIRIAPMVLIVFIENAFKHSKNTFNEKVEIDISLKIAYGEIRFRVDNSYSGSDEPGGLIKGKSGIGLANVTRRLDLLYGKDYRLRTNIGKGKYAVQLDLKKI